MNKPRVIITERLDEKCAAWLNERADVVWHRFDAPGIADQLADADALVVRTYTKVDDALLDAAPKLRVVGRAGVGLDNIDLAACAKRSVRVVYTPDANTQAVVEYVFGLMLDHFRPRTALPADANDQAFHALRTSEVGKQLSTMTLGIVGLGRIGRKLGRVAHTLGMNVWACDVLPESDLRKLADYPFEFKPHADLYAQSHIVTIHVDGRSENRAMLDAQAFGAMREDVLFINAARGMLVDHAALATWLREHPKATAMLDVHAPEPPPPSEVFPLRDLPNAVLLPHLASRTHTALENMSWVVRDIATVLDGQEPQAPAPA